MSAGPSALELRAAIEAANNGKAVYYDGSAKPALGEAIWDPGEGMIAVRVREQDVPYSCGIDCCGVMTYAVVGVEWGAGLTE